MLNVVIAAALLALPQIQVQSSTTDTSITVSVGRPLRIAANAASMFAVIEGTSETTAGAIARVDEKVKVVTDSLSRLGRRVVADKPVPYRMTAIIPQAGYGYPSPTAGGFITHVLLRVRVPDIQDLAVVQSTLLSAGAASITGQTFEIPDSDDAWAQNTRTASSSARAAAATLAAEQGKRLGRLVATSSHGYGGGSQSSQISLDPRNQTYGAAPEVVLTTTVTLVFQLLPGN